jgi:hypothetical protein
LAFNQDFCSIFSLPQRKQKKNSRLAALAAHDTAHQKKFGVLAGVESLPRGVDCRRGAGLIKTIQ